MNAITITPNNRLQKAQSEFLARQEMVNNGTHVADAANILSMSDFIRWAWEQAQCQGFTPAIQSALVTQEQAFLYWVDIIKNDDTLHTIMAPTELANMVSRAHRHLGLWELNSEDFTPDTDESARFQMWDKQFSLLMKGRVTEEAAIQIVIDAIVSNAITLPEEITLWAFDEVPPLIQSLFDAISASTSLQNDCQNLPSAKQLQTSCFDNEDQLQKMAAWAYNTYESNPTSTIAIVVPDLVKKREDVIHALDVAFEPQTILPNTPDYLQPYNVSAGTSMSLQPIIAIALDLLTLGTLPGEISTLRSIVMSPFIGGADTEAGKRALFDLTLQEVPNTLTLAQMIELERCPPLLKSSVKGFQNILLMARGLDTVGNWLKRFEYALLAMVWPGERAPNSKEYQVLKQHNELLHRLCNHYNSEQVNQQTALFYYHLALNNTLYSAESKDCPIQVLGLMEAAGLTFDYMYVLDMNDSVWPAKAAPTPFLPELLQIEHGMPHADASRELDFAKQLLQRFTHSCHTLVYSYCEMEKERELSPSLFVSGTPVDSKVFLLNHLNHVDLLYKQIPIKTIHDFKVPLQSSYATGGVSLLKDEALCPFSAFVKHRLKVSEMPTARMGFSPQQRGVVLHASLAFFWEKLKSHEALISLSQDQLEQKVNECIETAFLVETTKDDINPTLVEMESSLLSKTILKWLEIESERPPFIVHAIEKSEVVELGPLKIRIRIDRKDSIVDSDGDKIMVLDYKSGLALAKNIHMADTLTDVQLPICAVASENVDTVAYASLKPGAEILSGLADPDSVNVCKSRNNQIASAPTNMRQQVEEWRTRLESLAEQYASGVIDLTPSTSACQFCSGKLTCRIKPA